MQSPLRYDLARQALRQRARHKVGTLVANFTRTRRNSAGHARCEFPADDLAGRPGVGSGHEAPARRSAREGRCQGRPKGELEDHRRRRHERHVSVLDLAVDAPPRPCLRAVPRSRTSSSQEGRLGRAGVFKFQLPAASSFRATSAVRAREPSSTASRSPKGRFVPTPQRMIFKSTAVR